MKNILLFLIATFSLGLTLKVAPASEIPNVSALKGTYQGQVFNGNDLDPVLTTFKYSEDGTLSGTYAMGEENGLEVGTLSNFKLESEYVLVCTWKDKYGKGSLRILFSADLSIFRGFWGPNSTSTFLPWNGVKQK